MKRNDEDLPPTADQVFRLWGTVARATYRREWIGPDYMIQIGRFHGSFLSDIKSETWIRWALEGLRGPMCPQLKRALIDQYNSLHV